MLNETRQKNKKLHTQYDLNYVSIYEYKQGQGQKLEKTWKIIHI